MSGRRIGQRRMREHDLLRRKGAWVLIACAARAEKRHLESHRLAVGRIEPTGHVPPLGAEIGMRAVIGRELQRNAGPHLRERRVRRERA